MQHSINSMKTKEPGLNKKHQKEEVGQTFKNGPKEKTVSIVEKILRIQGVNALQRTQSVLSVKKREIIALFASPKAKEGMLTSYKPSLSMRPYTKTVQRKTIRQCILLQLYII